MDLFDIIGPVMIGPSSSHTAGAARIGKAGLNLLSEKCIEAKVFLHGSFSKTYQGHGTDRALIGGLLGMEVDDPRIRISLDLAKEANLIYQFEPIALRGAHPNTVLMKLIGETGKRLTIRASSIGGGNIRIDEVDGLVLGICAEQDTLVIKHHDAKGVIAAITGLLAQAGINIATIRDFRSAQGGDALMAIETDSAPDEALLTALKNAEAIESVTFLTRRIL